MKFSAVFRSFLRKVYYQYNALLIRFQEKTFINGVKYIFIDNHSDKLLVIFSGIGGDYNYRRSLKNAKCDQLYIKDSWADGLSYYLYENGNNQPETLTSEFIETFIKKRKYQKISCLGSSKGGSAALYFGMKHSFNEIYAGACQYKVGNYIGIFHAADNYYSKLMGNIPTKEGIALLNRKFEAIFETKKNCQTVVFLLYSTEEHTYVDDIVFLIKKLKEQNITYKEQIETFPNHSMIGLYMSNFCKTNF